MIVETIIQKMKKRSSNYNIVELKEDKKDDSITLTINFLNNPILIIEYDSKNEYLKNIVIKGIQGLNESLSYILLDFIDDFPEMDSEEFKKLSKFEKTLHYAINTSGIILNQVSLSNSNLFMKIGENDNNVLIMLPDSSMIALSSIKKTDDNAKLNIPNTVYSVMTRDRSQNQIVTQILESIKVMVQKGEELGFYKKSVSRMFIKNTELLLGKIEQDAKSKILKSTGVLLTKASIVLTVIYLLITQLTH